jgi:ABC-type multidrug transport system permease subunit
VLSCVIHLRKEGAPAKVCSLREAIQMIDDLVGFVVTVAISVKADKAATRHRWVRILQAIIGLLFFAAVVGLIYLTFKYS